VDTGAGEVQIEADDVVTLAAELVDQHAFAAADVEDPKARRIFSR
jgi:hypothetical protein